MIYKEVVNIRLALQLDLSLRSIVLFGAPVHSPTHHVPQPVGVKQWLKEVFGMKAQNFRVSPDEDVPTYIEKMPPRK